MPDSRLSDLFAELNQRVEEMRGEARHEITGRARPSGSGCPWFKHEPRPSGSGFARGLFWLLASGFWLLAVASLPAQPLEALARDYRLHPTPTHHNEMLRYANAHVNDQNGALALFSLGVAEASLAPDQRFDAVRHLKAASGRLPKLADYVAFELASAESDLKLFATIPADLFPVWNTAVSSPLIAKAALMTANADLQNGESAKGIEMLRRFYSELPQPDGDFRLASCYEAGHDFTSAAVYYQRVYYGYPASAQADPAAQSLARLRASLASSYPPAPGTMLLDRAAKLLAANFYTRARNEYQLVVPQLAGADRDLASVGIGVADYAANNTAAAYSYLKSLQLPPSEAEAQRLYYLAECARRMDNHAEMNGYLEQLGKIYPYSKWRLKALISTGNHFLMTNESNVYVPMFQAAYEIFPTEPEAAACHWKVTWASYLNRRPEAADLLREHLTRYPSSSYASNALYFLGRSYEAARDLPAAKACYQKIASAFSGYYYANLAEDRLRAALIVDAFPSQTVRDFLSSISLRTPPTPGAFVPNSATRLRLDRANLLATAALDDLAEEELRFGAATGGQAHVFAMELAQITARRGSTDRAIRVIKKLVPDYFALPFDTVPQHFWELAFPLPYRTSLVKYARANNLDPYLVAGLIRQESEFNPKAVSPAQAYGLTQVLPSTGRQLARKLGVKRFRTALLLQPDTNLRFGAHYLKTLLDEHSGKLPQTLASYNAGGSRVAQWLTWADYREPAEFIENIPFSETRNYVQIVLRNAAFYRRLYGPEPPPEPKPPSTPAKRIAKRTR